MTQDRTIACNLAAMTENQRERYEKIRQRIQSQVQEFAELPDGYALRFPGGAATCLILAEFITLERLCCPFLTFNLEVSTEEEPIWLRLTGREGVKDFLRQEFG